MSAEFYAARMLRGDDGRVHWFKTVEKEPPPVLTWAWPVEYLSGCGQTVSAVAVRLWGPKWVVTCPDCLQAAKEAVGG